MPRFHALARQVELLDVFMAAAGLPRDDRLKHTTKHVGKTMAREQTAFVFLVVSLLSEQTVTKKVCCVRGDKKNKRPPPNRRGHETVRDINTTGSEKSGRGK